LTNGSMTLLVVEQTLISGETTTDKVRSFKQPSHVANGCGILACIHELDLDATNKYLTSAFGLLKLLPVPMQKMFVRGGDALVNFVQNYVQFNACPEENYRY